MRYDFGGGCRLDAFDEDITIVDIQTIEETECIQNCEFGNAKECKSNKYIIADIFSKNLILPKRATFINVCRVLRYCVDGGWLISKELNHDKLQNAAENIDINLLGYGIVRLEDHMAVLEDIIEFLLEKKYEMLYCRMIEFRDEDYPAIWEILMEKK